jgi:DivIVA domain-containing protein
VALVLLYLLVLVLVAIVLFGAASLLFGRGERLPPLPRATTATVLPAFGVTGADVDAVKFTQVLRGYKTSEVDWVLDRLGRELETLRGQLATIRGESDETHDVPDGPDAEAAEAIAQDRSGPT